MNITPPSPAHTGEKQSLFAPLGIDHRTWITLCTAALVLILIEYFGNARDLMRFAPGLAQHPRDLLALYQGLWWSAVGITAYLLIPAILIYAGRERLRDYGVRPPTSWGHLWIYAVMLLGNAVLAYFASHSPSFLRIYPYYAYAQEAPLYFALFWAARVVRFFALEFFFRGYLIFALKRRMGDAAILVSMVPYAMIHFGKPLPETLFAVIGGIIFGWIAIRTRSIFGAVVLHVGLALTMDLFALAQKTGLL